MIKKNYYKVVRVYPDPSSYFYIKNETMSEGQMYFYSSWLNTVHLEYSFDKINWTLLTSNDAWINNVPADGFVYFRNNTGTFGSSNFSGFFNFYVKASIGGDVRTLFNYTDVDSVTAIPDYGFYNPFAKGANGEIIDISNLSFRGITSIGDYGLQEAFRYVDALTKGVDLRDVTTLGERALESMYAGCHNLTEVYAPNVSTWDEIKSIYWLNNVSSTGVVYKPSTLNIPTNNSSGVPSGWTTQDYPTI